eukprot:g9905.t1
MGFFDQENTRLETVWFIVLATLAASCLPLGTLMGRRSPILAAKLVPVICLLLAYENIVLALSNMLSDDSALVQIGRTTRAAVIPLFLVVMFEVAYAVHKRRSVKFCGIVFDQGHRRGVEPCSWVLRNFVRIVAMLLFVVGILVNYDIAVGNDRKAGGTGLVETEDASAHLLLALLPTTGMAAMALYIAVYMWKYGNDASIVVQSTVCNGWIFLFLGTLALLAGQVPPEWCFRVVNESGQVLLLLSLIAIGREIGREVQAADNFSSFLDKENELEIVGGEGGAGGAATTSADLRHRDPHPPRSSAATASLRESPPGTAETAFGRRAEREREGSPSSGKKEAGEEKQEDEEEGRRRRISRSAVAAAGGVGDPPSAAAGGEGDEFEGLDGSGGDAVRSGSLDDVSRPMPRRGAEPDSSVPGEGKRGEGGRGGVGLSLSSILHQSKGPKLLGDTRDESFLSGMSSKGEDTPDRDHPEEWGAMSAETAPTNGGDSVPFEEEEVQRWSGTPDPGLKHLRKVDLTSDEQADYASKCQEWLPALVKHEGSEEGWKLVSTLFGVKVWSTPKANAEASLVTCKGQMPLSPEITLEFLKAQFVKVFNTTETLAQEMKISDPMSRSTRIMCQIPCEGDDEFIRIVWGSFKATGVAWARDFCMLQKAEAMMDPSTGERLFCLVSKSVERPEVPDMQKLCKRIRATADVSGFVFREPKDGGPVRITYVVNVNPNGWIPTKLVNIICNSQAMNVSRVRNKLAETAKALAALKLEAPISSKVVGWRLTHEMPIPRPAHGAAAANASVKFLTTCKVAFRIRGAAAATTDWTPAEVASSGVGDGAWVTYPAHTAVAMEFKMQPEAAAAAPVEGGDGATGAAVSASGVELEEGAGGVVLEWKATVRFMDGTVRNLGRDAFKEMMNKFPATEPGIMSIQCYMQGKGASGTVYRNSYRVVNDKGLAVTGTSSFTTLPPGKTAAAAPSSTWSEREIKLEKCLASSINKALDAVTLSVVRYLEAEQAKPTRILSLQCDYVVDAASQIWLTWIGDTTIATADAARDLRLANVALEGPRGRGEFLGPQNALDMQREFGGPPGPTRKTRRRGDDPAATAAANQAVDIGKAVDRAAEVIELPRGAVGAGGSGGIADLLSRVETAKTAAEGGLPAADPSSALVTRPSSSTTLTTVREQSNNTEAAGRATTMSTMTVGVRNGDAWGLRGGGGMAPGEKRFPSSFACAGDYCTIRVLVATRLFSGQELSALRRDASFRRQIEEGLVMEVDPSTPAMTGGARGRGFGRKGDPVAGGLKDRDPRDWSEVSWKSVCLARQEKERRACHTKGEKNDAPFSVGAEKSQAKDAGVATSALGASREGVAGEARAGGRGRLLQETESSSMRQHARKREDELLAGGAQNFYKPVRVCGSCFRVYALLDKARATFARQEALAAEEADLCERSDFLDSSRSPLPRRRRPRAEQQHDDRYGEQPGSIDPVSLSSDEMQGRRRLRVGTDGVGGQSAAVAATGRLRGRPRSQGDEGSSQGRKHRRQRVDGGGGDVVCGRREAKTWRGRLEEGSGADDRGKREEGAEKGPSLSSGKKFEDLDNYLRGCASASATKREKRKRRLGQGTGGGGDSFGGTMTTDGSASSLAEGHKDDDQGEDGSGLFHARVLLAEADPKSAKRVTQMLEEAGYMVTVEGDGKQVLEALIDGDGEWDALVVERDTPVMDGFQIASSLRDFEKARRNRAATVRAAAVEEHGRTAGGPATSGLDVEQRAAGAPTSVPPASEIRHLPVICLTSKASPDDLRSYMAAGMDGCVSKPADPGPLLNTLRAAVPLHLSPLSPIDGRPIGVENSGCPGRVGGSGGVRVLQGKGMGVLKGSAACAAEGMALATRQEDSVEGALQVDADTSVPYCVVGSPPSASGCSQRFFNLVICHDLFDNYERMKIVVAPVIARYPGAQVLLWNYPGQAFSEWRDQQLLNNEYLSTILQYLLLHLGSKSDGGTGQFDSNRPYHLVGFGSGGAVATFYASHFASPSPRSLLLLNSFSYVDAYLAGVLHDCVNVFNCAPESRPDLPVYFHARFLFSPAYLGQVSTPLALNIYTAVHNPISVKGRLQLCRGALAHVDTRPVLSEIDIPVICIQSTQNNFVKPLHTDPYVSRRGGEVRSIHKARCPLVLALRALQDPSKTCVVWVNAGHEIFQEARAQTTTLLEQAISGYHEGNDVVYAMSHPEFATANAAGGGAVRANITGPGGGGAQGTRASKSRRGTAVGGRGSGVAGLGGDTFEDKYIDNVLGTMSDMQSEARHRERGNLLRTSGGGGSTSTLGARHAGGGRERDEEEEEEEEKDANTDKTEMGSSWDGGLGEVYGSSWENYRASVAAAGVNAANRGGHFGNAGVGSASDEEDRWRRNGGGGNNRRGKGRRRRRRGGGGGVGEGDGDEAQGRNIMVGTVLDASHPAFERQDNLVYGFGQGSKVYPQPEEFPEVKEYMSWRLKRNRKRLVRLDRAARRIQSALRAYLAMKKAQLMRENRACVYIQAVFRGWRGRLMFLEKLRAVWAAQVVQRNWRGYASRRWFQLLRRQQAACGHMQRVARGALCRWRVRQMRRRRDHAATLIQALWRGVSGRRHAFRCREEKYNAMTIQRVFRGHTGRRRAGRERDKYLFSKSQSQGIDFGRQMLLEHKLHATRLQSDVQLLTGEKVSAEEAVEAMMEEISEFEEAVTVLEREMHQLSKIETEAVGVLDEEARMELREQKVRLDKEFGEMLGKIADRKDRLLHMEKKLATLDRTRLGKEVAPVFDTSGAKEELRTLERKLVVLLEEQQRELDNIRRRQEKKGMLLLTAGGGGGGDGGGGPGDLAASGGGGPSAKDKRQAAQLMQSTETLMKFGFMSMSMTYFSSLNMIRAMRSVGASDTVMAALAHNANGVGLGAGGGGGGGGDEGRALALEQNEKLGAEPFRPALKPGQLPGQESLAVSAWSVDDVARWLQASSDEITLTLSQYQEAFIAAAVDGAFLYDLNDDDLKSSLGVEHRLHRKKILNSINRLKAAEAERVRPVALNSAIPSRNGPQGSPDAFQQQQGFDQGFDPAILGDAGEALGRVGTGDGAGSPGGGGRGAAALPIHFKELVVLTRRGKYKQIREILEPLPDRRFDPSIVRVPYVSGFGTAYVDAYEQEPFNLNKVDDHGNTLLMVAAQNGNLKTAKLFVNKGANPNHQNKAGHTAGHYAISYQFFDLSEWLFLQDGNGGGADDTIENSFGLGPYDGLQPDSGGEGLMLEAGA